MPYLPYVDSPAYDSNADILKVVGKPVVLNATGTSAIASTTAIAAPFELVSITLKLSATGTTNENFTVTLDANDGANYDTLQFSEDLAAESVTDLVITPDNDGMQKYYESGDEVAVAWPNTEGRTYYLRIETRLV